MLLNRYFAVLLDEPVDQHLLWFRQDEGEVFGLTVLLLERITGRRASEPEPDGLVSIDPPGGAYSRPLAWLTPDLLNHVLTSAQRAFSRQYFRQLRDDAGGQWQVVDSRVIPANAARLINERLFRLELCMHGKGQAMSTAGLDMLRQVLARPLFNLREGFGFEATECFVPVLVFGSQQTSAAVCDVMVFQQPLNGHGKPVQWSVFKGLREFDSFSEMQLDLIARFTFVASRERWLSLIAEPECERLRWFLSTGAVPDIRWIRVDGDCFEQLAGAEHQRQCRVIESAYGTAVVLRANAQSFANMTAAMALDDKARILSDNLAGKLQLIDLMSKLPDWLKKATIDDQLKYRDLLVRFRQIYALRQPWSVLDLE